MAMIRGIRKLVRAVDRHLVSRLPASVQYSGMRLAIRLLRKCFPSMLPQGVPDDVLARRRRVLPSPQRLPAWAVEELRDLAVEVDSTMDPVAWAGSEVPSYQVPFERSESGSVYFRLRSKIQGSIDAVILVPWLKQGGADRWAIALARVLAEDRSMRVLVLSTEASESPWKGRLPSSVQFIEAGFDLATLFYFGDDAVEVVSRLLIQLSPKVIHVVASRHGWEAIRKHGLSLRSQSSVYASLFCDEFDVQSIPRGFAESHLSECAQHLDAVLVDNDAAVRGWIERHGLPKGLFRRVDFPWEGFRRARVASGRRVLWAGRFDRQKRLDLLARLAEATPDLQWDVHGAAVVPGHGASLDPLKRLPNVTLHGEFASFGDIVNEDHGVYVYTSAWDGMPTILLDAAGAQLPIVAPDVGGISDFLMMENLVSPPDSVEAFVRDIREMLDHPERREHRVLQQNDALARRTWSVFESAVP